MDNRHDSTARPDEDLLKRLHFLESELDSLRQEFSTSSTRQQLWPEGEFPTLRMHLGQERYGIPIAWVQEIVRYVTLARVPDVPAFVAGTINVRGDILPVIDGRTRFGLEPSPPNRRTVIVLLSSGDISAGLIVDKVSDVVVVDSAQLQIPTGPLAAAKPIGALASVGDEMIHMLDIARLLSRNDWDNLSTLAERTAERPETDAPIAPDSTPTSIPNADADPVSSPPSEAVESDS